MEKGIKWNNIIKQLGIHHLEDIVDQKGYSRQEVIAILGWFGHQSNIQYYYSLRNTGVISDPMINRGASGNGPVRIKGVFVKKILERLS